MSKADVQFLRGVELRLLRCTLSPASPSAANAAAPPPPSSHPGNSLRPLIESVVAAIERGSYAEALSSEAARVIFPFADSWDFADTVECVGRFYGEVESRVSEFLQEGCQEAWLQCLDGGRDGEGEADAEEDATAWRAVLVMCIGVAALLAFVQRNMTGPTEDFSPFPLLFSQSRQDKALNGGEWDVWARSQLTSSGCDVLGKFPLLQDAERACRLSLSVTGVLGFRTVHQVDAKSQLVLVAETEEQRNSEGSTLQAPEVPQECSAVKSQGASESQSNDEDCDILMIPRLLESSNDPGIHGKPSGIAKMPLTAEQQAIILAQCLHTKKRNPDDELSRWEVAPFIEAVDAQQQTYFIIRCFCDILRIRWESTRSRTKQRALLMMDKLVDCVCGPVPSAAQRICFSFGVYVPTIPALRKEYGRLLVSNGMIGEALKTFEDLELWDDLIYCYRLLDKKSAAVDLIKARLNDTPNDPRLWCSLGDVTNTDAYYEKALEVSNDRSARAKARDIDKAIDAFTRAVQLDPENGEAWNNIACLHMIKKRSKESFIAFKEALKFRRSSWQLWENFSHVAMDVDNFTQVQILLV
ncbi:hypothetical protein Taro_049319 [Colocasia esculenta]|uniref:Uncharacterized protein n=1 Tax=Colocasia esculenta TaxID=4460 RepID=A0A843XAM4_COLES|nr:hypothetical protein [Colocasia esculenta]